MLMRKIPFYKGVKDLKLSNGLDTDIFSGKFYIELPALPKDFCEEKILLNVPNTFQIRTVVLSRDSEAENMPHYLRENCFYFKEHNETILEITCFMQTLDKTLAESVLICLPISAPDINNKPLGVYFDGIWIRILSDGEILNQSLKYELFCDTQGEIYIDSLYSDIKATQITQDLEIAYRSEETTVPADFYMPAQWNSNVGDVVSFYHDGVYHLMYLYDRRNHCTGATGAHYFAHLTSENLTDWYEQVPVAEIDAPWKSYGTGTMLFHNGKYYMTYGFHTERYGDKREKIEPKYNESTGKFENITCEEALSGGRIPAGASYSVSENGIDFVPSNIMFHSSRNPSAFTDDNGEITVYAGYGGEGVWKSNSFNNPFRKSKSSFIFSGNSVAMKNTSECPSFFDWNGYRYLVVGVTGYYRTLTPESSEFVDAMAQGENVYDGLVVPMVTKFGDDRRLIAGFVRNPAGSYAGALVQRELVQKEKGKLGRKWVPELLPKVTSDNLLKEAQLVNNTADIPVKESYLFEATVTPNSAQKIALQFINGEEACELQIDIKNARAQFNDTKKGVFGRSIKTNFEQMPEAEGPRKLTDVPCNAHNYCIPDVEGIDKPFKIRVISRYSRRFCATVLDVEIAGLSTLFTVRKGFCPESISILADSEIKAEDISLRKINYKD